MPTRPLKPCSHQPCPRLTTGGPCPQHTTTLNRERGSAHQRGYGARHRQWRKLVLARDPLCVRCEIAGRTVVATDADHVIPLATWLADPDRAAVLLGLAITTKGIKYQHDELSAWSLLNGQGLCHACHSSKTATESSGWGR